MIKQKIAAKVMRLALCIGGCKTDEERASMLFDVAWALDDRAVERELTEIGYIYIDDCRDYLQDNYRP